MSWLLGRASRSTLHAKIGRKHETRVGVLRYRTHVASLYISRCMLSSLKPLLAIPGLTTAMVSVRLCEKFCCIPTVGLYLPVHPSILISGGLSFPVSLISVSVQFILSFLWNKRNAGGHFPDSSGSGSLSIIILSNLYSHHYYFFPLGVQGSPLLLM
jgi:hypothetical protein